MWILGLHQLRTAAYMCSMYSHDCRGRRITHVALASRCLRMRTGDLPRDTGGACNLIIKGAVVNCAATALVELHYIQTLAAVVLKSADALVLLQHAT